MAFALRSIDGYIAKGELTADDYRAFAKAYMPTMDGTFHLGMLAETTAKRKGLERWKKELGADWDRLRVIITGPEGRLTAAHTRDTYLAAQFWRLAHRIGKKKAAIAVAHSILVIAWHLLAYDSDYTDLGGDYFTRRNTDRHRDRLVRQLQELGYYVTLDKIA